MLRKSHYLPLCHHVFVNIGFYQKPMLNSDLNLHFVVVSSELINRIRHSFASLLIISYHFLSKNQNLNLHFLLLAWDLQWGRHHHFYLLPSSIVVSDFRLLLLNLSYEALKSLLFYLFVHHFCAKLLCLAPKFVL